MSLEASSGEAPSKNTDTLTRGNWMFGSAATPREDRATDPATITSKAKARVVLALDKAKSTILVIHQTGKLFVPSRHFLQILDQAQ